MVRSGANEQCGCFACASVLREAAPGASVWRVGVRPGERGACVRAWSYNVECAETRAASKLTSNAQRRRSSLCGGRRRAIEDAFSLNLIDTQPHITTTRSRITDGSQRFTRQTREGQRSATTRYSSYNRKTPQQHTQHDESERRRRDPKRCRLLLAASPAPAARPRARPPSASAAPILYRPLRSSYRSAAARA